MLAVCKVEKRVSKRIISMYPEGVPPEVVARTAGKLGSHLVGCRLTAADRAKGRARANHRQRREAVEVYADLVEDVTTPSRKRDGFQEHA